MIKIAHISDVHFDNNSEYNLKHFILPSLIKDFKGDVGQPDFICISGDLLLKGGMSFKNGIGDAFKSFQEKFIEPLILESNLEKSDVFFAPGNHDIDRSRDADFVEAGLRNHLVDADTVFKFISENKNDGIGRIIPFKEFEKNFYKETSFEKNITKFHSTYKITKNDYKIGISCLNSAWRCWDSVSDNGNLLIGERQLVDSVNELSDCDFKIAIMHHPVSCLAEFDKKSIEPLLLREFNLVFCGHGHEGTMWSMSSMYGNIFVSVAPSSWDASLRSDSRKYAIGYYMITVDFSLNKIITKARRYNHDKTKFDPNSDLGDDNGVSVYGLPSANQKEQMQQELEASSCVLNFQTQEMNEHLLSFSTETSAPKTIKDIFVMPTITDKIKIDSDEKKKSDERIYSLEDMCSAEDNLLVFGQREIGKTILLDRIVIELAEKVSKYHRIPVFVDFDDIGNKKLETIISKYLHVKITEVDNYLKNNNLLIVIDNINFDSENKYKIRRIEELIEKCSKIKVIATILQNFDGQMPLEILNQSTFSNFKFLTIKPYKTKEIKKLIKIWFSENEMFPAAKLDKLLSAFGTLNLPRTPLAISMFLWIFEQQENYKPINQATMLENFIEKMFKKQSKKEILSSKFDYRNKERLLTDIAYEMYNIDDYSYRISYTKLLEFIEDKFRAKKFEIMYNPVDVLQHFIDKGVLLREYDGNREYVRFRFTCFFQYFMMKKMEFDKNFCNTVLKEENFLFFDDEIDYYTGIKRDKEEILKILVHRMNEAYKPIVEKITTNKLGFDDIFNVEKSMTSTLNENFIDDIRSNPKPSEDEIDLEKDRQLEKTLPDKEIKRKGHALSPLQKLEKIWTLTAKVLKNSEEIEAEGLKELAYKSVLKASMAFSSIYKYELEVFLEKNMENISESLREELIVKRNIVPWLNEVALFMIMGTNKLNLVIKEKILSDIKNNDVSDYEKFLSIFLYSDLKGNDYMKYVKMFVKGIRRPYMYDMSLFKVISYYIYRSKNKEMDLMLENIMADVVLKSKNISKTKKNDLMKSYRKKRSLHKEDKDPLMVY